MEAAEPPARHHGPPAGAGAGDAASPHPPKICTVRILSSKSGLREIVRVRVRVRGCVSATAL